MKIVIWFFVLLVGTILNVIIGNLTGFMAGYLVLYLAESYIAKKLCEKWDDVQSTRKEKNDESS